MNTRSYGKERARQQRRANRIGLLAVALMLFSMCYAMVGEITPVAAAVSPDTDSAALAQDGGDDATDDGQDATDDTTDTADDTADTTDDTTDTADDVDDTADDVTDDTTDTTDDGYEDDTQDDVADGTDDVYGFIDIYKYSCEAGYDPSQDDSFDDYTQYCEAASGIGFTASSSSGYSESLSTDSSGYAGFSEVPIEPIDITEDSVEGYYPGYVTCASSEDPDQYSSVSLQGDNSITVDLGYAESWTCIWLNYADDDYDITIYKYVCEQPEMMAFGPGTSELILEEEAPDPGPWLDRCTSYTSDDYDPFSWSASDESGWSDSQTTGDEIDDGVVFTGFQGSSVSLQEDVTEGYATAAVFCTYDFESSQPSWQEMRVENESVAVEPTGDSSIVCYWFNEWTTGGITIIKYFCPEAYTTTEETTFTDLYGDCTDYQDDVTFNLKQGDTTVETLQTGDSGDGTLVFDDPGDGSLTVEEQVPDGYRTAYFRCFTYEDLDENTRIGIESDPIGEYSASAYSFEYSSGDHVVCYVYNVYDDMPSIDIVKYQCPEALEYADYDWQDWGEACTTPQDDVTFDIEYEDGAVAAAVTGSFGAGQVTFPVAGPTARITEQPVSGYTLVAVFCEPRNDLQTLDVQIQPQELDGSSWTLSELGEVDIVCYVYNIPSDDTMVQLDKYTCPEGWFSESGELNDYVTNCTETLADVTFDWTTTSETGTVITDADGKATITLPSLADDDFVTIAEVVPEGYGAPYVFCSYLPFGEDEPVQEALDVIEGGTFTHDLNAGDYLYCAIFNMPTDDGTITVYKYICPYNFDWENASYDDLMQYCEVVEIPIPFTVSMDGSEMGTQETGDVIPGGVLFSGFNEGPYTVTETYPEGYEPASRVFCSYGPALTTSSAEPTEMMVDGGGVLLGSDVEASADTPTYWYCDWFNFQAQADDNTITIHKWECPVFAEDVMIEDTQSWLLENCTVAMADVEFTVDDSAGVRSLSTGPDGVVTFDDVNNGPVTVSETIPTGYGQPSVFCGWTAYANGAVIDAFPQKVDAPYGVWETNITYPQTDVFCDWFNFRNQPGDITIWKYWCPEGYDLYAYGADPWVDCDVPGEGVQFDLGGETRSTDENGMVFFEGLEPDTYTVTETYPEDTAYSFVLKCFGGRFAGVQPYPLALGSELDVPLVAGDHITCYWFNVPDPDYGWVTVYKYWCSTETYKSEVDCQIYENGITFELYDWTSKTYIDEKTTSEFGELTFAPLDAGSYYLEEQGWDWCKIDIDKKGAGDGEILVESGQETVVKVYNCDPPKDDPGGKEPPKKPAPKQPTKYPNTGVDPSAFELPSTGSGPTGGMSTPLLALVTLAALIAAAGGLVLRRRPTDTVSDGDPQGGPSNPARRMLIGGALASLVIPVVAAAQDTDPSEGTPSADGTPEGTPDVPACREDATPDADDPDEDPDCIRGEVPKHITIEAIGVDADIEIQEIIAGAMQDPTGPTMVTWYKETSRLGERGNGIYAGHLNYWGIPEGVFFGLKSLQPGDEIVLTGENDEDFVYAVQWVQNEAGQEEPEADVLGLTEDEALTLITCGGEWDTTIAEYNERTTVRAVRLKAVPEG